MARLVQGHVVKAREGSPRHVILLVDDCLDSGEMYAEALGQDFLVALAASGAEAVERASKVHPAVVVMDWSLPDMTGEEAISRMRASPRTGRVPVIILSGYPEPIERPIFWDAYFVKPCDPVTLSSCIARLLERPASPLPSSPRATRRA